VAGGRYAYREVGTPYPEHLRGQVDAYLDALSFPSDDAGTGGLVEAMRYSLLAGGKRLRPVLALATCASLGHDPGQILPSAAALELVHTYSLIHDDLPAMDDDDLRRGRPTCHVVFGEDTAILAGDALFAEAVRLVCEEQMGPPEVRLAILTELSRATGVGGMVGGQFLDLAGAGRESIDAMRTVHALKTGCLIRCAVRSAMALAGPPEAVVGAYDAYAQELGLGFQIVDDILDVEGSSVDMGKATGSDARSDTATYVSLLGADGARRAAAESRERALQILAGLPGDTADLRSITTLIYARRG
jgi:geranylgeranyl diphosphate synthase type II